MLPYFRKSEDQRWGERVSRSGRATLGGAFQTGIHCATPSSLQPARSGSRNDDFNGEHQRGANTIIRPRAEVDAQAALSLTCVRQKRTNLRVHTEALVTRIRFEGRRAVGVEYQLGGRPHLVRANREVLVCGGSSNTAIAAAVWSRPQALLTPRYRLYWTCRVGGSAGSFLRAHRLEVLPTDHTNDDGLA